MLWTKLSYSSRSSVSYIISALFFFSFMGLWGHWTDTGVEPSQAIVMAVWGFTPLALILSIIGIYYGIRSARTNESMSGAIILVFIGTILSLFLLVSTLSFYAVYN